MILPFPPAAIEIREALAITDIGGGRSPIPNDPVLDRLAGGAYEPQEGDKIGEKPWTKVNADKDGWLPAQGYLLATVDLPADATMSLQATGDSLVYVNGVPRAGAPYESDAVHLPVHLVRGHNTLLFLAGRGRMKARLVPLAKILNLDLADTTLPDATVGDHDLLGGIVVANGGEAKKGLRMRVLLPDGRSRESALPPILGESVRKLPVALPMPYAFNGSTLPLRLELRDGKSVLDAGEITLRVRQPGETLRRTFVSDVDGSVQYYVVNPAIRPGSTNVLALTLHGASVEAQNQAQAYRPKEDVTLVAPTNRRPFGFDWEEIGRVDALEVLAIAERTIPHDPARVVLTGHSMGGHGTWSIGTLYPDRFAAVAPSAGWISWWTYGNGWNPAPEDAAGAMLRRAMNPLDPLPRLPNTLAQGIYILHGDADDNVPVTEARTMRDALVKLGHPDLNYHEEPGAGHWWGDQAVDYPDLFAELRKRRLDPNPAKIDFTTPAPYVSAKAWWASVDAVTEQGLPARINLQKKSAAVEGTTENVARLTLARPLRTLRLDGQTVAVTAGAGPVTLLRDAGVWREGATPKGAKTPEAMGPFKAVLAHKVVFVVPTGGTREENEDALRHARYDSETLYSRGNGGVDAVTDAELLKGGYERRNVLLYGNADTNRAWGRLLRDTPVTVRRGMVTVGDRTLRGDDLGVLLVRPKPGVEDCLVAAIAPTGHAGAVRLVRTGLLAPASAYPDWTVIGGKGLLGAGFFGNDWSLKGGAAGWNP